MRTLERLGSLQELSCVWGKYPHSKLQCVDPFLANRFYKKEIKRFSLRVCARMCVCVLVCVLILRILTITDIENLFILIF